MSGVGAIERQGGKDMTGMLARSLRGHDKSAVYLIVKEDDTSVYLCDGRLRTLDRLKKKNRKHIQVIKKNTDFRSVREQIGQGNLTNEEVQQLIRKYILKP